MVGTSDFTVAEWCFMVGNLILAIRLTLSPQIDNEGHRPTIIFGIILVFFGISCAELFWVGGKRAIVVSNHPTQMQAIAIPVPTLEGSGGTHLGGPSTPNGILPPNVIAVPSAVVPKPESKPAPKPKTPEPPPAPTQMINSPDPYFGIPNSTVAVWTSQMAAGLSTLGNQCMQAVIAAQRQQMTKNTPTDSTHPPEAFPQTPEMVQIRFWWSWTPLQEPLAKLHDSLVFRLGPVETIAEEEDYKKLLDSTAVAKTSPTKWSWAICQELPIYAHELQTLEIQLHP